MPGLLCSARLFDPVLPTAWSYGAVTVADNRRDDTIASMANRLLAGAPQRFVLVGFSLGGYVAYEVIRRAPERVSGLVLISTSARPDTAEQRESRRRQRQTVLDGGFGKLVEAVFPALPDPAHSGDERLLAGWRLMAGEVGPEVFVSQLDAVVARPDSRPGLAAINCPTGVIHGSGDRLITADNATETAEAIPGAVLTLIDGASHMLPQEQPAAAQAALAALLNRVAGTS